MLSLSGINLIKFIVVAGLAIWNSLESVGLIKDFTGAQKMVGRIMNMEMIEEKPTVRTALMNRRISQPLLHKAGAAALVLFNLFTAILLFAAIYGLASAGWPETVNESFLLWANYGTALFLCMSFSLSFVGLWFAYYIKQSDLMITHFAMIILGMATAIVINI